MESKLSSFLVDRNLAKVAASTALSGAKYVGIYFTAHWCGPCRQFSPALSKFSDLHSERLGFKVVMASLDRSQDQFTEYFKSTSFPLALPPGSPVIQDLSHTVGVAGIPTLAIFDINGELITSAGREHVMRDPNGKDFPWKPKPATELLKSSPNLVGRDDLRVPSTIIDDLDYVGIYFSAHWCPPCKAFTPVLAKWYTARKEELEAQGKKFDIVFNSLDRNSAAFNEYLQAMPWKALDFDKTASVREELANQFEVSGIPSLVFLDAKTGKVLTSEGVDLVRSNPNGMFPTK